jgi:hypothetical protein
MSPRLHPSLIYLALLVSLRCLRLRTAEMQNSRTSTVGGFRAISSLWARNFIAALRSFRYWFSIVLHGGHRCQRSSPVRVTPHSHMCVRPRTAACWNVCLRYFRANVIMPTLLRHFLYARAFYKLPESSFFIDDPSLILCRFDA